MVLWAEQFHTQPMFPTTLSGEMEPFSALILAPSHTAGGTVTQETEQFELVGQRKTTAPKKGGEDWWKVQPKYSPKVLIGNWLEERKGFVKPCRKPGRSIYSTDFTHFPDHRPERTLRTVMMKKYEDQNFNSIIHNAQSFLLSEPPTNYGLLEHLKQKWHRKEAGAMSSVYTVSYKKPPTSAFASCQFRCTAQPHGLSSRQGHLPRVSRILDCEGGQKYLQALGQLVRDRKARAASM
ncbi:UNVERIFIED_CONTAM: hypothetical protein H355_002302 [Colinus virginianus]|nr:hypothetical protein H355_002302 [Colinus virginianus]